jgi:hypothetical protein
VFGVYLWMNGGLFGRILWESATSAESAQPQPARVEFSSSPPSPSIPRAKRRRKDEKKVPMLSSRSVTDLIDVGQGLIGDLLHYSYQRSLRLSGLLNCIIPLRRARIAGGR